MSKKNEPKTDEFAIRQQILSLEKLHRSIREDLPKKVTEGLTATNSAEYLLAHTKVWNMINKLLLLIAISENDQKTRKDLVDKISPFII